MEVTFSNAGHCLVFLPQYQRKNIKFTMSGLMLRLWFLCQDYLDSKRGLLWPFLRCKYNRLSLCMEISKLKYHLVEFPEKWIILVCALANLRTFSCSKSIFILRTAGIFTTSRKLRNLINGYLKNFCHPKLWLSLIWKKYTINKKYSRVIARISVMKPFFVEFFCITNYCILF